VERQRRECVELAEQLGWTVADAYVDNDVSAYSGVRRPEYERLLADCEAGRITGVLAWHPGRLNRSPSELERLIDVLERNRVELRSVTAGFVDLTTPSGRAVARTLGAWARYESEHKAERLRSKHRQRALAGLPCHGPNRPFGYAGDRVTVIESEAAVIRRMMRRLLAGQSTTQLTHWLNDHSITTANGARWNATSLERVLCSPRIAGWRCSPRPKDTLAPIETQAFLVPAQWPAIVSRRQVERARELILDKTVRAGSTRRHLLSGIALCGLCGSAMARPFRAQSRARDRYTCRHPVDQAMTCRGVSIVTSVEDDVTDRLLHAVEGGLVQRILDQGPEVFAPSLHAAHLSERRCLTLRDEMRRGRIAPADYRLQRNAIQREARMDRAVADATTDADLPTIPQRPDDFRAMWEAASMRRRRSIILTLTTSIRISPRPIPLRLPPHEYDPSRVTVTWRA
jgi:DNA invertase Pin-like site-specific DNA recombinase